MSEQTRDPADESSGSNRLWYRTYWIFFKGEPSWVIATEEAITAIQDATNQSKTAAYRHIWKAGLMALKNDPTFGQPKLCETVERARFYEAVKARAAQRREFEDAYKVLGPNELQEMATEFGVDINEFMDDYRIPQSSKSPSSQMRDWIQLRLGDGEEHELAAVVEDAIEDGILPEKDDPSFDGDYQVFKVAGSRLGVSGGRRGWWQTPLSRK